MNGESIYPAAALGPLSCRVLLVEDDQDHQRLLSLMLQKSGAQVTVAENGQVAVEAACRTRDAGISFDLIVMDVQMPVLDGLSATRMLRAEGFRHPVIALTARTALIDRQRCLAAGCDGFLTKPVSRADLARLLATHLPRLDGTASL